MRILFLEWTLSSKLGGMELCMFDEAVQLRRLGHVVTIAYNTSGDLLRSYAVAGINTIRMSAYSPRRRHFAGDLVGLASNLSRSLPLRLDLVVANSYHSTFFAALLARLRRVPLVCHLRLNPPLSLSWPGRIGLREVSRFVAESASVRDLWVSRGTKANVIDVAHDGIDVDRFRPIADRSRIRSSLGLAPSDFVILTAGRLDPVKDLEGLLRTFAIVRQRAPRARLVVAGSPSSFPSSAEGARYVESLKELAASLGVARDVRWIGQRSDMPELYGLADVATLFGRIPEPFGRVTCEALACGRPMVTPQQGGSREILVDEFKKLLFKPGDYEDAARLIVQLQDWQRRDPGFADRARMHICRGFSLEAMGVRIEKALQTAISAGSHRNGPSYRTFSMPAA